MSRSGNDGISWPDRYPVIEHNTTSGGTSFEDEPAITANHDTYPQIQVVWTKRFSGATKSQIWFAHIADNSSNGTNFDTPAQVSSTGTNSLWHQGPTITVGPDNFTHFFWIREGSSAGTGDLVWNFFNGNGPSSSAVVSYFLPKSTWTNVSVYDILGDEVLNLVDEYQSSGEHRVRLELQNASGGVS